jgi:hypothetical protein
MQESFEALIAMFRLTVSLWMVDGSQLQRCARELEQGLPESTDKHWVMVRNDHRWQPMKLISHIHEGCSH